MANSALTQFLAKLERRDALPARERDALLSLHGTTRDYGANETIVATDDRSSHCVMVAAGLISRVKTLEDGARQIVAFHMPGDAVDLQSILFTRSDHDIVSHMPTRTFWVAHEDILTLTEDFPVLARALWLDTLVDAAIFREWTVNVGQRNARQRIVHLFLEMAARFEAIGLLANDTFELPVTQTSLAEALGLSLVHLNKSLQALRKGGFLAARDRRIFILKRNELVGFSGFDPGYLHLDGSRSKTVTEDRSNGDLARAEVRLTTSP